MTPRTQQAEQQPNSKQEPDSERQPVGQRRVTGYTVVLPPGWSRVPVRQGSAGAVRAAVDEALKAVPRSVPRDRIPPYRAELEGRLRAMVNRARGQGGVDLYLPVAPMHGIPVSASFLVSEGTVGGPDDGIDPAQVATYLATEATGDGAGTPVTVDGTLSARREHTAPPDEQAGIDDVGSRRVDYMIPVPGDRGRWLLVAFSTLGAGNPEDNLAGILVELFDAIMSTFRWTYS